MAEGKFVAYYRVSTKKQGASGLGLDAQKQAVMGWLNGGNHELLAEYQEVESGKDDSNRPELHKAIHRCKMSNARLIIAKLDRLSRNVAFIATLMDSGVKFVAVDMPGANEVTVHVMAAMAQQERKYISERTTAALAEIKAGRRQTKSGRPLGPTAKGIEAIKRYAGNPLAVKARQENAQRFARNMAPIIADVRQAGITSQKGIAEELNRRGITTPTGKGKWSQSQVGTLLLRQQAMKVGTLSEAQRLCRTLVEDGKLSPEDAAQRTWERTGWEVKPRRLGGSDG